MIQSVERAFSLLYTIGLNKDRISVSQLARDVDLPRTTVVRLLETLQAVGAVKTAERKDEYQLGDKLLALLNEVPWQTQLRAVAQPCLQTLAEQTGETIYLCLPDGDQVLYATQINSRYKIQVEDATGQRYPMHVTAPGKLFLAHRSPEIQAAYFAQRLERYTEMTILSNEMLETQFIEILQTGHSWTRDEFEIGYVGLAAPIFNQQQELVGAVALGAPKFRIRDATHEAELVQFVSEAAQQISKRL
ncbi:MAG: IclR family transcriptional regulator [Chloroflexota bacterium]